MRSGKEINFSQELILSAIKDSSGIVSNIAEKLNCSWATARRYIDKWEATKQALKNENEVALDFVENQLMRKIEDGDSIMIRFFLATKGKRRGYTERQEIAGAEGEPFQHLIVIRPPEKTNVKTN